MSTIGAFEGRPDEDLAGEVKAELEQWFGKDVRKWELLRNYRIPYAQPNQVQFTLTLALGNPPESHGGDLQNAVLKSIKALPMFPRQRQKRLQIPRRGLCHS